MNVNFSGELPVGVIVIIKLDNEIKEISEERASVSFQVAERKEYGIEIFQKKSKTEISKIAILFFLFTIALRGIF